MSGGGRPAGGTRLAVALLLAAFALLCAHGLRWDSPTVDEFAHLPAGYYYLRTGNFMLYSGTPPLIRELAALPLLALDPPPDVAVAARLRNTGWYPFEFATDFMQRNRARYDRIFTLGRLPIVALAMLGGLLVFRWARELYGEEAGLVALYGYAFCPTIVAHAHLVTVDAGHAVLMLLALYLFHRYRRRPGWAALLACGVALGLAQLAKYTAVLLYPILLLIAGVALAGGESLAVRSVAGAGAGTGTGAGDRSPVGPPWRLGLGRRLGGSAAALAAMFLVSLAVLDAGYLFRGLGRPVAAFHFQSRLLRAVAGTLPPRLPLPLPAPYLAGFDAVQLMNDEGEFPIYLMGHWSRHGSPAYYPIALLVKTPLPLLAAWLALAAALAVGGGRAARAMWRGRAARRFDKGGLGACLVDNGGRGARPVDNGGRGAPPGEAGVVAGGEVGVTEGGGAEPPGAPRAAREYTVWLPAAVLLAVFVLMSKIDYGIRYVLPVLPLALIYTGRLVPWARRQGKAVRAAAVALLLVYPLSILLATPDTIDYFNLLAGGRGDRILIDSNLDWGQGLKRLRAYMDRERLDLIPLAYFGHVDPEIYGIRWRFPEPGRAASTSTTFADRPPRQALPAPAPRLSAAVPTAGASTTTCEGARGSRAR